MTLPVYTLDYLFALFPNEFRKLGQYERGDQRTPIGKPLPDPATQSSWFVVRIGRRKEHTTYATQAQTRGTLGKMYFRTYYSASHYDYMVCSVNWDTGHLTEHRAYKERAQAYADVASRAPAQRKLSRRAQRRLDRESESSRYYTALPTDPNDY